jgi:hypothetical protein
VVICILGWLEIVLLRSRSELDWLYFLIASALFVFGVSLLLLNARSDVVIDGVGIYRVIYGVTWQMIAWECVGMITVFPVHGGPGSQAIAFNLFPKFGAKSSLRPFGKMFFDDKLIDCEKLIEFINFYAKENRITLKVRKNLLGELVTVESLQMWEKT